MAENPYHWDIDPEDLEALNMNERLNPELTSVEHARNLLERSAPQVALGVVRLATSAANERVRLDAAKYVLDRTVYKVDAGGTDDPLTALLGDVVKDVEQYVKQASDGE